MAPAPDDHALPGARRNTKEKDNGKARSSLHLHRHLPERDGGATITLAPALPGGVPEANWLPAPAGRFRLGLRVYYPGSAVADGSWTPPAVIRR